MRRLARTFIDSAIGRGKSVEQLATYNDEIQGELESIDMWKAGSSDYYRKGSAAKR